jgi:hypothetical protein
MTPTSDQGVFWLLALLGVGSLLAIVVKFLFFF